MTKALISKHLKIMIRIIERIAVLSLDRTDTAAIDVPIVPASGIVEIADTHSQDGRLRTITLSAVITRRFEELYDRLNLSIVYCDGGIETYGTEDLPLRLDIKTVSSQTKISAKYEIPLI